MAHSLHRLAASLYNTPLLTTQENLIQVQEYINSRNAQEDFAIASKEDAGKWANDSPPSVENGVGLLSIEGSISYQHNFISALCGLVTYQKLNADFEVLVEQGAHTVVLDFNSGGGEAHGMFESAQEMRQLADEHDVRIISYVDGMAASAAMGLAAISDEIIMNPMSKIGSIGVVISIVNELPKKIEEGSEVVFVYSGGSKIPYEKDGKLREDFIEGLQEDTDALYVQFIEHVAKYRPMTSEAVRGTQAKMYRSEKAVELGLADKIMTAQEFINYLADLADERTQLRAEGTSNMPLFRRSKKKSPELSTEDVSESLEKGSPSEELLEGFNQEGEVDNPSMQSNEDKEVDMTYEEFMASPEGQAKLEEMASAKAAVMSADLKEQLAAYESEKLEAAKSQYKDQVAGFSFIKAESQDKVATFLFEASDKDGVKEIIEALGSAQAAVDATVDTEVGSEGEQLEVDADKISKSAVSEAIAKRYATK